MNLDRYGGADAWERHVEEEEQAYLRLISDKICADCDHCSTNSTHGCAYCFEREEEIDLDEFPANIECMSFRGAA